MPSLSLKKIFYCLVSFQRKWFSFQSTAIKLSLWHKISPVQGDAEMKSELLLHLDGESGQVVCVQQLEFLRRGRLTWISYTQVGSTYFDSETSIQSLRAPFTSHCLKLQNSPWISSFCCLFLRLCYFIFDALIISLSPEIHNRLLEEEEECITILVTSTVIVFI